MSVSHSTTPPVGTRFGSVVVKGQTRKGRRTACLCQCDCGNECSLRVDRLKSGRAVSCGCKRNRIGRTHGHCRGDGSKRRAYRAWSNMLSRCRNPAHKSYPDYGGRGITVCERWVGADGFPNFLADMGEPQLGQSLDRENNEVGYRPGNCRWADRKTQQRNKRGTLRLTIGGETMAILDWCERYGISPHVVRYRIKRGWVADLAVTTPAKNVTKKYGG